MKKIFNFHEEIRKLQIPSDTLLKNNIEDLFDEFINRLKEDLKKEFCSGFISLSKECFEREWNKSINKFSGNYQNEN